MLPPSLLLMLLCVLFYCCCCGSSAAASCLLFVVVRRMAKFVDGSFNLISAYSSHLNKRDIFWMVPLGGGTSHLRPRFAYILGNYGQARSQGGRQPAAKPPLCICIYIKPSCGGVGGFVRNSYFQAACGTSIALLRALSIRHHVS